MHAGHLATCRMVRFSSICLHAPPCATVCTLPCSVACPCSCNPPAMASALRPVHARGRTTLMHASTTSLPSLRSQREDPSSYRLWGVPMSCGAPHAPFPSGWDSRTSCTVESCRICHPTTLPLCIISLSAWQPPVAELHKQHATPALTTCLKSVSPPCVRH